jgi:hypothetical protein
MPRGCRILKSSLSANTIERLRDDTRIGIPPALTTDVMKPSTLPSSFFHNDAAASARETHASFRVS